MSLRQLKNSLPDNIILKEKNIFLRPLTKKDSRLIVKWRNNPEIQRWFFSSEQFTLENQVRWYEEYKRKEDARCFIICEKRGKPIGTVSLYDIDLKKKSAQFGRLLIGEAQYRGRGYAKQATKAIIRYAFCKLKLKRVFLEIFKDNIKAISIYRKCGFQEYGISGKRIFKQGRPRDIILMHIRNNSIGS